ncbi:lytic transglycosylase domain-containing protein [Erwinia sp. DT-104]|jgi:soluble lytic murein transglycosylase-like protein|uniref:Lytic transglycosylase domain-containing protein n=2 Tax=Erwinia TaxID=551 RepID=A0ABV4E4W5_9GAMM|nr:MULTISPECIES: transglycosylase SLT domain-containing protein [unclassified Erwinia]MDN4628380.1 transglycosylase SLT domain-containing protein [Erwinia sp. PsM31]MDN8541111.1 transglycosylase SLT domain-containing protein [Erwinia sp. BC051422]
MMTPISSANALPPTIPGLDSLLSPGEDLLSPLNEKHQASINFAQSGSQGTSLESLLDNNGNDTQQNSDLSQQVSQLISEIMKAVLPLIQQLLQGQQASSGENGATGSGSTTAPVTFKNSGNPAENSGAQTAVPALSAAQTSATSGSSPALSLGSSDLHLPDSLKPFEADIQDAAQATGVPANVLAAQIWQESRGNLGAATVNGGNGLQDAGLMQVNSNTFADLQSKNPDLLGANASPDNAHDNIMAGALYMKEQLGAFDGSMGAALRAYNSGPNNVNTADLSDISKTGTGDATYVDKVMDFANTIATGKGTLPA